MYLGYIFLKALRVDYIFVYFNKAIYSLEEYHNFTKLFHEKVKKVIFSFYFIKLFYLVGLHFVK